MTLTTLHYLIYHQPLHFLGEKPPPSSFNHTFIRGASLLILAVVSLTSCGRELTQGNSEPFIVSVGPLTPDGTEFVNIHYSVADFQRDDATIDVSICTAQACFTAVSSGRGDGTQRIPTVGTSPTTYTASHVFSWKVACGLFNTSNQTYSTINNNDTFWVEINVSTTPDKIVKSSKYTLDKLGISPATSPSCHP